MKEVKIKTTDNVYIPFKIFKEAANIVTLYGNDMCKQMFKNLMNDMNDNKFGPVIAMVEIGEGEEKA